jgi:hypothetical protein
MWGAIFGCHSNEMSEDNTFHEYKSCTRSRTSEQFCFSVSCLFCDYWQYFDMNMWIVVYCIKKTVYNRLFMRVIRDR